MKVKNSYKEEFIIDFERSSLNMCKFALLFVSIIQVANILFYFTFEKETVDLFWENTHITLHCILLFCSLAVLLVYCLLKKELIKHKNLFFAINILYVGVFLFWGNCNAIEDMYSFKSITIYCVTVLTVSAVANIRPWMFILLLTANHGAFFFLNYLFVQNSPNSFENYINSTLCVAGGIYIYFMRYLSSYQNFKNNKSIIEQNHRVLSMNNQLNELIVQLNQLVKTDYLSALYNRRYLNTILESEWCKALQTGGSLAVLMLDIDDFKKYNDSYGHTAGDECLVKVSEIIKKCVFDVNSYSFRYGGEEFTVLIPNATEEKAHKVAEAICNQVAELHIPQEDNEVLTVSIGVYRGIPTQREKPKEFIEKADKALYNAKKSGKNRVCWYYEYCLAAKK